MKIKMFNSPAAVIFLAAWEGYAKHRPSYTRIADGVTNPSGGRRLDEAWPLHRDILLEAWLALMEATLSPVTWVCLRLLRARRNDLMHLWLMPGGYFYTRRKNVRKHRMDKLRPKVTVTMLDDIVEAEELYTDALDTEGNGFVDKLRMGMLALSGAIIGAGTISRARRKAILNAYPMPEMVKWRHNRPWDRSFSDRSGDMLKLGILSRPDERILK